MDYKLTFETEPRPDDRNLVDQGLYRFDVQLVGPENSSPLNIFMRDEDDQIVGSQLGTTYWGWLYIATLGSADEAKAVRRGCKYVHLDTLSFQAPGFYLKLRYTVYGQLDDFIAGHTPCFLRKTLPVDRQAPQGRSAREG